MNEQTILQKELGTNSFVTNDSTDKLDRNSADIATIYRRTESGLRDNWKKLVDQRDSRAEKVEKDLKDFYSAISKKYNVPINSRNDFLNVMETLASATDIVQNAKVEAEKANAELFSKSVESTERKDRDDFINQIEQSFSSPFKQNVPQLHKVSDRVKESINNSVDINNSGLKPDKLERRGLKDKFNKAKEEVKNNSKALVDNSVEFNSNEIISAEKSDVSKDKSSNLSQISDKEDKDEPIVEF